MDSEAKVQALDEMDHATFDATLIHTWRPSYQWTYSNLPENDSFAPADFALSTRRSIAKTLGTLPDMKGQKLEGQRDVLDYIAFETLYYSVQNVHLRPFMAERFPERLRTDFQDCLTQERLLTAHSFSPLWGKGKRIESGAHLPMYEIPLQSTWDRNLLKALSESRDSIQRFIETCTPRLATLDRGHVTICEEEFRQQMIKLLEPSAYFFPELQSEMRQIVIDTWLKNDGEKRILAELEKIKTEQSLDLLDDEKPEDRTTFIRSIESLLDTPESGRAAAFARAKTLFPGLEYLALEAAQDGDLDTLQLLQPLFDRLKREMKIRWGDYPSLAFVQYAIASYCTHIPPNKLLVPKDLLGEL